MPRRRPPPVVDVSQCLYEVVRECALERGWQLCEGAQPEEGRRCTHRGSSCPVPNVLWIDTTGFGEAFRSLHAWQRLNHFPGLSALAKKSSMALHLSRMKRLRPREYPFLGRTWILPLESGDFKTQFPGGRSSHTFIVKPSAGAQGRGILLTRSWADIDGFASLVAQRYIARPLLMDGYKFDLRLYVLITSCAPLRIYLFRDGLMRLCNVPYERPSEDNMGVREMHLTNYAINKAGSESESESDGGDDDDDCKRSLQWCLQWLADEGHDVPRLWEQLEDLCVKAIIPVQPLLEREYRWHGQQAAGKGASACFALLGLDVLLDEQLQPWLLEVNHLPSFRTDTAVDRTVKQALVRDTMAMIRVSADDRRAYQRAAAMRSRARLIGKKPRPEPEAAGAGAESRPRSSGSGAARFSPVQSRRSAAGGAQPQPQPQPQPSQEENDAVERERLQEAQAAFELANAGGFRRVFPPADPARAATYAALLEDAVSILDKTSTRQRTLPAIAAGAGAQQPATARERRQSNEEDARPAPPPGEPRPRRNWEREAAIRRMRMASTSLSRILDRRRRGRRHSATGGGGAAGGAGTSPSAPRLHTGVDARARSELREQARARVQQRVLYRQHQLEQARVNARAKRSAGSAPGPRGAVRSAAAVAWESSASASASASAFASADSLPPDALPPPMDPGASGGVVAGSGPGSLGPGSGPGSLGPRSAAPAPMVMRAPRAVREPAPAPAPALRAAPLAFPMPGQAHARLRPGERRVPVGFLVR